MKNYDKISNSESGVAIILTVSILTMMLLLLVSYATLSKTEVSSAASYRDNIASRYMVQAALNRAMAEVAYRYASDGNTIRSGISTLYSSVSTNPSYFPNYNPSSYPTELLTLGSDIERVSTNTSTLGLRISRGGDGTNDYVVLPGMTFAPGQFAQWIAMYDTNNVMVGRVAYIVTASGLNINAIGNQVAHLGAGQNFNSRNQGLSVAELNLPAALIATDSTTWPNDATARTDANEVLTWKYGTGSIPGPTNLVLPDDGLDNNGDGVIDNGTGNVDGAGGSGVPQDYLSASDGTISSSIVNVAPNNTKFTDLKKLYDLSTSMAAATQTRFQNAFAKVQRWFVTESSFPIPSTMINLNNTNSSYYTNPDKFFQDLTNRFANMLPFSTNSTVERSQIAANIVTYAFTNTRPFTATANGTNVVGVGQVPYINQMQFDIVTTVTNRVTGSSTGIVVYSTIQPTLELWYPFTNAWADGTACNVALASSLNVASGFGQAWGSSKADSFNPQVTFPAQSFSGSPGINVVTNATQFKTLTFAGPFSMGTPYAVTADAYASPIAIDLVYSNFAFSVAVTNGASSSLIGFSTYSNIAMNIALRIQASELMASTNGPSNGLKVYTNSISFTKDDPRVNRWYVEYAGSNTYVSGSSVFTSIGKLNFPTNLLSSTCHPPITTSSNLFSPKLGEDTNYFASSGWIGIAPKTFYVKGHPAGLTRIQFSSVGELGRIHRGQPWKTIDLKGGGTDGNLLDNFYVFGTQSQTTYAHGRVSINSPSTATPIWAALFAGMPLTTQNAQDAGHTYFVDITANAINPTLTQSIALGRMIGSRAGSYSHLGALTSVADLSNIVSNYSSAFPGGATGDYAMTTDEDKEMILTQIANLVGTQSQGSMMTIYAWGQSLRGPTAKTFLTPGSASFLSINTNRTVAAETMLVAMVRPDFNLSVSPTNMNMRIIYYRYNPEQY